MKKTALSSSQLRKEKLRVDIQFLEKILIKSGNLMVKTHFLLKRIKK